MSVERRRRPKGERAHIRAQKARARQDFVPSIEKTTHAEIKAQARLTTLTQQIFEEIESWVNQANQPELQLEFNELKQNWPDTGAEEYQKSLALGRFMTRYLTAKPSLDKALDFVERIWLRLGLKHIDQQQFRQELGTFLNACPSSLQPVFDTPSPEGLTPLEQAKNRIFNPITGVLDPRLA